MHTASQALAPPDLRALGALPFTLQDRATLGVWLTEEGWPRSRMDIVMLEGYLIALLVWPVRIQPGAWLPPIWGEKGWKVPAKIDAPAVYKRFVALVVGFLQDLDHGISDHPRSFTPTLTREKPCSRDRDPPSVAWGQGFRMALQLGAKGLDGRTDAARSAVSCIARYACSSRPPRGAGPSVAAELSSAVLMLAGERESRGPLGAIEHPPSDRVTSRRVVLMQSPAASQQPYDRH
jgi:yecA family protein